MGAKNNTKPPVVTVVANTGTSLIRAADIGTEDIRILLDRAAAPVIDRPRAFAEWITGASAIEGQLAKKWEATKQITVITKERTRAIEAIKDMVMAARGLEDVETAAQRKQLAAEVERLRLEAERLRLTHEISQMEALQDDRLTTRRLEEGRKQKTLRDAMAPPPPAPVAEVVDEDEKAVRDERRQRRVRSNGAQSLIKDFLAQVRLIMLTEMDDAERQLRLTVALDAYGMESADLPVNARKFLVDVDEAES